MSLLDKILKNELFKARHGIYADTAENRRLHRVGQEYGHAAKEEVPGAGRKPAQQDDEQGGWKKKLGTLPPGTLSNLADKAAQRAQELRNRGDDKAAEHYDAIAQEAKKHVSSNPDQKPQPKPEEEDWRWDERENEVGNKVSALGGKLVQVIRDGGDTKGVEGEISEALKEASDKQLRSTVNSLNSIRKRNKTKANEIALKLTQQEIDRRKRESGMFGGMADEDSEKPKKKPETEEKPTELEEKGGDDVKVEARMTFDDIPNSGKVKMAKYLSGFRKNKVDEDFKSIRNLDRDTIQTLHDGLVSKFNEEFDGMSKADRAEALYKIAKIKNELQKNDEISSESRKAEAKVNKKSSAEDGVGSVKVEHIDAENLSPGDRVYNWGDVNEKTNKPRKGAKPEGIIKKVEKYRNGFGEVIGAKVTYDDGQVSVHRGTLLVDRPKKK